MRQLITRIPDELHAQLKDHAAHEGKSVNALVTEILTHAVGGSARNRYVRKLEREGRRYFPPQPDKPPGRDEVSRLTRGVGRAVSEALEEDRSSRW